MAHPKRGRGMNLSTPRLLTVAVSVLLAGAALASLHVTLPVVHHWVAPHRLLVLAAGYGVLLAGVLLRGL